RFRSGAPPALLPLPARQFFPCLAPNRFLHATNRSLKASKSPINQPIPNPRTTGGVKSSKQVGVDATSCPAGASTRLTGDASSHPAGAAARPATASSRWRPPLHRTCLLTRLQQRV
uniref:Uncharacterized protein n=1 Tax=Triticum urartu TaxID=4572 RepID=A0A8R7R2V2_TRIUA